MAEFFDYDPRTGVRKMWDYDEMTGTAHFRHEQDLEPFKKFTMAARNEKIYDGRQEMNHYAELPTVVQIELRNKGIDIYSKDPTMIRRMLQEIDANYRACKVTDKVHRG